MFNHKVIRLINTTLCNKIDLLVDVKVKRSYCIGHTADHKKLLQVYITKTHKNRQLILPNGQSLFLLMLSVPNVILKNDRYLFKTFMLSNEELEKKYINVKVCFLVDGDNIANFVHDILNSQQLICKYLVSYGTSIFVRPLIESLRRYRCDEYYFLKNVVKLKADFILEEKEESNKLSYYGKRYCLTVFSNMCKKLPDIKELLPIQEDSGTEEEEEKQPAQALVETCIQSLSSGEENLRTY
ncbi:DUF3023 domain-containing protein [Ehrlichia ruminantium]|uniref:DUF3023 domain-containing protein n=1 Tax=Ehrlichia ruminantium (strain Welgevonden) TaxID=254945 RepID=A0A0H3LZB6_EHRRW|nr:DUF3023 domain-containing protein [Ehrlichia ruminantium]QLK55114.1 DUF3023 domain-containing protein [Ehrlichia ruminantium]QLK56031.1 DUF3023 domain-containing protein [Ehrlichia ruminantium]UOE00132.1 DUF3023 domain-containing protein [Ehrlichia ruminantium]CAH58165.1 hypothetical protein Erum4390 [Ehrlichia ruminantium str. Welgevonden]CAI26952.1 Hypothetical protein ERWE_CDS_04580 [Ehrlichia ruminantium str. Welgevonden]